MTEDEKMIKIRERFPEIVARVNFEKNTDYQNISNREKLFFAEIFEFVQQHDKSLFKELFTAMITPTDDIVKQSKKIEQGFNLKEHLLSSYLSLVGRNSSFEKGIADEDLQYAPTVENLYTNYKYLSQEKAAGYEKTARQILDKIISSPGKANAELKNKLEKVTLKINVFVSEDMDGKCQYDGKFGILTISLSEGCFGKHKNALGMVMGHEMGHFIDVSGRPAGYAGKMRCSQEIYADAVGYKIAASCGFDLEHYKAENRRKGRFFSERMDVLEKLQVVDNAVQCHKMGMMQK